MTDYSEEIMQIINKAKEIIDSKLNRDEKLAATCNLLRDNVTYYDWVGFYIADQPKKELILGPFVGEPTEHTRIAFGEGICGQAAAIRKPFVVQDVRKETNYLSCSVKVMSEIVFPIMKNDQVVGELDIDSHTLSPFTDKDNALLGKICAIVADLF
jgi:GAF domain-containing protein